MRKEKGLRAVGRSKSSSAQEEPLVAMLLLVKSIMVILGDVKHHV